MCKLMKSTVVEERIFHFENISYWNMNEIVDV